MQGRVRRLKIDTLKKAAIACKYEESPETAVVSGLHLWRSGRDSNPRAAHHGNTISSRARYDLFDTTPNRWVTAAVGPDRDSDMYYTRFLIVSQEQDRDFYKITGTWPKVRKKTKTDR